LKHSFKKKSRDNARTKKGPVWHFPILGFLLLPCLVGAALASWTVLRGFTGRWESLWPLLAGAGAYAAIEFIFSKPLGMYVFGHELTHALAALFSGIRVKSFSASPGGGEVILSGTNVWVALAPYCLPIYTFFVVGIFQIVQHYAALKVFPLWFPSLVGFTFAFHISLTIHALLQQQPDLRYAGPFFSLILILLANCFVLVLLMKVLYPAQVSYKFFLKSAGSETLHLFAGAWQGAATGARGLTRFVQAHKAF
jgi:hypothetical protein